MNYATPIAQVGGVAQYDRRAAATTARFIVHEFMNYETAVAQALSHPQFSQVLARAAFTLLSESAAAGRE